MKNILIWIGVALIVVSTVIAQFTGVALAQWVELAGATVGLAGCVLGIVNKAEKKSWKLFVSIIGIVAGTALLVFSGIAESQITTLISAVAGIVVLIVSLLPTLLKSKE